MTTIAERKHMSRVAELGVRAPMPGETGLSWADVHIAMREGQM